MTEQEKGQILADSIRKITEYHADELDTLNTTIVGVLFSEAHMIIEDMKGMQDE